MLACCLLQIGHAMLYNKITAFLRNGGAAVRNKKGFTLVEVIVVLVILAILAAVLVPSMIGWIQKAEEKSAITSCRACVLASQTLLTESYAVLGSSAQVDTTEAVVLAEALGTIKSVTHNDNFQVLHLIYEDNGLTVEYCAKGGCTECANKDTYTVNGKSAGGSGGTVDPAEQLKKTASETFVDVGTEFKALKYNRDRIDSIGVSNTSSNAYKIYSALSAEQQAFLDTVSWSIIKNPTYGYRLFFTESNYGTGSSEPNIKVYKYDFDEGKYQLSNEGYVKDGIINANKGFDSAVWTDTMEGFRE